MKKPCRRSRAIFVKFEDSLASLVYNGDMFEIISERKGEVKSELYLCIQRLHASRIKNARLLKGT